MSSYYMTADAYSVSVYEGELRSITFFGTTYYGAIKHRMRVDGEMLHKAMTEAEQMRSEQIAALTEERDALKEKLENLKETTK